MTTFNIALSPQLASDLAASTSGAPYPRVYAVYFDVNGNNPTVETLGDGTTGSYGSASFGLSNVSGQKIYFLIQSGTKAPTFGNGGQIQREADINPGNAAQLDFRYDSFEVTLSGHAADAGNLTNVNGFGIPMAVDVYPMSNSSALTRGYSSTTSGGAAFAAVSSAGGSGAVQNYTQGPLIGKPRAGISPTEAVQDGVPNVDYSASQWTPYIQELTGVASGATTPGNKNQIRIAGLFNGAPDGSGVWHNKAFYSYSVTLADPSHPLTSDIVMTPDIISQVKGTITITQSDLANSIYSTLGNATISGVFDASGNATSIVMNTGANNEWGAPIRDLVVGFTAGYFDVVPKPLNSLAPDSPNLNQEWNWDPNFAFGNNAQSKPTPYAFDAYAKYFFNETNSYGTGYSDYLTKAFGDNGPLVNVSDGLSPPGGLTPNADHIDIKLLSDSEPGQGYTQQLYNDFIAGPYVPAAALSTTGLTLNFNTGSTLAFDPSKGVKIAFMDHNGSPVGPAINLTQYGTYDFTGSAGSFSATRTGSVPDATMVFSKLPLSAQTSGRAVDWIQITVAPGQVDSFNNSTEKVFNLYLTTDVNGSQVGVLNAQQLAGRAIGIDGLATVSTPNLTDAYASSLTVNLLPGGPTSIDPINFSQVSVPTSATGPFQTPTAPLLGVRPGQATGNNTPFVELYQPTGSSTPTVYTGDIFVGWMGADAVATQRAAAAGSSYVSAYTNKLNQGGDFAKVVVTSGGFVTSTTAQADNDGQWMTTSALHLPTGTYSVAMQEYLDSGLTSAANVPSTSQTFTVAQGTVVSSGATSTIASGQTSVGITVQSGGTLRVSGGTAIATTLNVGGREFLISGSDSGTIVAGVVQVSSGATAVSATIASGGSASIYGSANATAVYGGGHLYVYGSGKTSGTFIGEGGHQWVAGGSETADLNIGSSTPASGSTVANGGVQAVFSGGFVAVTQVLSGGELDVYSGGSAGTSTGNGPTLRNFGPQVSGGVLYAYSGGVISNAVLFTSGSLELVGAGGSASGTTAQNGSIVIAAGSGAFLQTPTIQTGSELFVLFGGSGNTDVIQVNGNEYLEFGATTTNDQIQGGTQWVDGESFLFQSGAVASNTTVLNVGGISGHQVVYSSGLASGATVLGANQEVYAGGVAIDTTVSGIHGNATSTGVEHVYSGGVASNTTVQSGAIEWIGPGGILSGATISGGAVNIGAGAGSATGTITFAGTPTDQLLLGDAKTYAGLLVAGFDSKAYGIDFSGIAFGASASATYTSATGSGTLTVGNGTSTAVLALLGQYIGAFNTRDDGTANHGTLVTFAGTSSAESQSSQFVPTTSA